MVLTIPQEDIQMTGIILLEIISSYSDASGHIYYIYIYIPSPKKFMWHDEINTFEIFFLFLKNM